MRSQARPRRQLIRAVVASGSAAGTAITARTMRQYHASCLIQELAESLFELKKEAVAESCTDVFEAVQTASTATLTGLRLHILLLR